MKRCYFLINETEVHKQMMVYFVWLGESRQDKRAASAIQAAKSNNPNLYFEKGVEKTWDFLQRIAAQVYSGLDDFHAWDRFSTKNMSTLTTVKAVELSKFPTNPCHVINQML